MGSGCVQVSKLCRTFPAVRHGMVGSQCASHRSQGIADKVDNTVVFERSVMAGIVNVVMRRIAGMKLTDSLLGRAAPFPECPGVRLSDKVSVNHLVVTRGDVVMSSGRFGVVTAAFEEADGTVGVLAEVAEVRRHMSPQTVVLHLTGRIESWVGTLELCVAWRQLNDTELMVVSV